MAALSPIKKKKKSRKSILEVDDFHHEVETAGEETPAKKKQKKNHKVLINNNIYKEDEELDANKSFEDSEHTGRKKKKKKRSREVIPYGDEEDLNESILDEEQCFSPKKKMKRDKKKDVEEKKIEDVSSIFWPLDLEKELLRLVSEQASAFENSSYKLQMKKIDFQKISDTLKIPVQECIEHFSVSIEKTFKLKNLEQVVLETIEELSNNKARKPLQNPFKLYLLKNQETFQEAVDMGEAEDLVEYATTQWNNLTEEERNSYHKRILKVDTVTSIGRTPFDLFYEVCKEKEPSVIYVECHTKWKNLPINKKAKFIRKSAKILSNLEKDQQKSEADSSEEKPAKLKVRGPPTTEILEYLKYLQIPEEPAQTVTVFYLKNSPYADVKNGALLAYNHLKKMEEKEKESWIKKFKKSLERHAAIFREWENQQDEITIYLVKKINLGPEKIVKEVVKKQKIKAKPLEFHEVEMPLSKVHFKDEPKAPPLTALAIYTKKAKEGKDKNLSKAELTKLYMELDRESKKQFADICKKIKQDYANQLKEYTDNLGEDQRRLYLGVNRKKIAQTLKSDIFAEDYPCEQYPVYIKPKSTKDKIPVVDLKEEISFEDEFFLESPKKSKANGKKSIHNIEKTLVNVKKSKTNKITNEKVDPPKKTIAKQIKKPSSSESESSSNLDSESEVKADIDQRSFNKANTSMSKMNTTTPTSRIGKLSVSPSKIASTPKVQKDSDSSSDESMVPETWRSFVSNSGMMSNQEEANATSSDDDDE